MTSRSDRVSAARQAKTGEAFSLVHNVLRASGQPLEAATRSWAETRFGHSFESVRVHRDAPAAESARVLQARAYAMGTDIVFGANQFAPETPAGRRLLAHELTHVVQQESFALDGQQTFPIAKAGSAAEREAETISLSVMEGKPAGKISVQAAGGPVLARQPLGEGLGGTEDEGALLWESFRQSITLAGFDSDKAILQPEHVAKLKEFKQHFQVLLGRYPDSYISVIGHTDATDTEAHNKALGQSRADAVTAELTSGDNALPAAIIHAGSLGETMLAVKTKGREPLNRRVEIIPRLRRTVNLPLPKPSVPWQPGVGFNPEKPIGIGEGIGPLGLQKTPTIPNLDPRQKNWLEEALKKDPLIKGLPDWVRGKVIDALKDGDEMLAEKVIDALPLDDKAKAAVQAVVKGLLQLAKGKKFKAPESPPRQPDFGPEPTFPKMPGEVIIPGPKIPLPF